LPDGEEPVMPEELSRKETLSIVIRGLLIYMPYILYFALLAYISFYHYKPYMTSVIQKAIEDPIARQAALILVLFNAAAPLI